MNKYLRVFDDIYSPEECKKLVAKFDASKPKFIDRDIAEYYRIEEDSEEMAEQLWHKIKNELPEYYDSGKIMCLNTYFRYSKYTHGMQFSKHQDGMNQDKYGYRSIITFNIFLNDEFEGGETDFYDDNDNLFLSVKPKPGRGVLFDGRIFHMGNKVLNGCKYLIRTDVMIKD